MRRAPCPSPHCPTAGWWRRTCRSVSGAPCAPASVLLTGRTYRRRRPSPLTPSPTFRSRSSSPAAGLDVLYHLYGRCKRERAGLLGAHSADAAEWGAGAGARGGGAHAHSGAEAGGSGAEQDDDDDDGSMEAWEEEEEAMDGVLAGGWDARMSEGGREDVAAEARARVEAVERRGGHPAPSTPAAAPAGASVTTATRAALGNPAWLAAGPASFGPLTGSGAWEEECVSEWEAAHAASCAQPFRRALKRDKLERAAAGMRPTFPGRTALLAAARDGETGAGAAAGPGGGAAAARPALHPGAIAGAVGCATAYGPPVRLPSLAALAAAHPGVAAAVEAAMAGEGRGEAQAAAGRG
jgi:hypothetical protein